MSACGPQFTTKFCDCITDPRDPEATICGYIDRVSGIISPCDIGCCSKCPNQGEQPPKNAQLRRSTGTSLPAGFGVNLPQSPEANTDFTRGAASFDDRPSSSAPNDYKVWQIVLVLFVLLAFAIMSLFMA